MSSTLLQISEWLDWDHAVSKSAAFKCLSCRQTRLVWQDEIGENRIKFCQNCGRPVELVQQPIERRKYRPLAACLLSPMFTLEVVCRYDSETDWEQVSMSPMTGPHNRIKQLILWNCEHWRGPYQIGQYAWKLKPSTPLPLP